VVDEHVAGVSTRSVDDLVKALGIGSGISKSEVSRICAGFDEVVTALRTRRLDHTEFPYVYLDATYLHMRNATSQVVSIAWCSPLASPPTAAARSSAWTWATASTKCSGAVFCSL
jgi:hypothetical protein